MEMKREKDLLILDVKEVILGEEFESVLNNILCGKDGLGIESLYSNGQSLYNVATDSKSVTSLCYHIPFLRNHRRSQQKKFGNTYQFYLWRSPR